MYRCSIELPVRYDELSQSEREHASLIDEYTRFILRQTGSICVLTKFAICSNKHSFSSVRKCCPTEPSVRCARFEHRTCSSG